MKIGHKVTAKITAYDARGRGMGEVEIAPDVNRECVIPFTAVGDEVVATFVRRDHGFKVCQLEKILAASPDRVEVTCPHAGSCGGCIWQHLDYKAQTEEKMRGIREMFTKLSLEDKVLEIIPAEEALRYRNRMDFAVGWNGEIGLKEYGRWNKYVDLSACYLMQDGAGEILKIVKDWMQKHDLQPWDVKYHSGDVRYVVIRDGVSTGERMVIVVVADAGRVSEEMKEDLKQRVIVRGHSHSYADGDELAVTSLLIGEQPKPADLSYAESFEVLHGKMNLTEVVNGVTYEIHPNSFFQTNTKMAAKLQDVVLNAVSDAGTEKLLDLYCGLGFFGIAAAKKLQTVDRVDGYELDEQAINLASQNAELNNVADKCSFVAGEAEKLEWQDIDADTVILDPPRSGLHPKVIKTLLSDKTKVNPKTIIYVSCNYKRLEHELPAFLEKYKIDSIQPLDLFPQTRHVEVVVIMSRRSPPEAGAPQEQRSQDV